MPNAGTAARAAMIGLAALLVAAAGTASAAERYWPPIVDPPTGQYTPGRWVWGDLVTSDVATAADFYGAVFGWTFETYGGDATGDRQPAHEPSCAQAGDPTLRGVVRERLRKESPLTILVTPEERRRVFESVRVA